MDQDLLSNRIVVEIVREAGPFFQDAIRSLVAIHIRVPRAGPGSAPDAEACDARHSG